MEILNNYGWNFLYTTYKPLKSVDKCNFCFVFIKKNYSSPFTCIWLQCSLALRKMADTLTYRSNVPKRPLGRLCIYYVYRKQGTCDLHNANKDTWGRTKAEGNTGDL